MFNARPTFALILPALFLSASAIACPDLGGTYELQTSDGHRDQMTVVQTLQGTTSVYQISESVDGQLVSAGIEMPADNQLRPTHGPGTQFRAWCDDTNALRVESIDSTAPDSTARFAHTFSLAGANLRLQASATITFANGSTASPVPGDFVFARMR